MIASSVYLQESDSTVKCPSMFLQLLMVIDVLLSLLTLTEVWIGYI